MTLEQLVIERLSVDLSGKKDIMDKWNVKTLADAMHTRLLALISDKDKEILEKELTVEKRKVVSDELVKQQEYLTECTNLISEIDAKLSTDVIKR